MNNKIILGIVVVVIIVGGGAFFLNMSKSSQTQMTQPMPTQTQGQAQTSPAAGSPAMAKNAVTIQNFAFSPATLTVKVGDTVTWTNQDSAGHSATADDASFDTGILPQGQSGTETFRKAGTFTYHCSVHPNMKATIIVQ